MIHPDPDPNPLATFLEDPSAWSRATQALQRVARSIVGDDAEADDIVQSAWMEALQEQESAKGMGWMRKLVRSRSIDSLRRQKREAHRNERRPPEPGDSDLFGTKLDAQRAVLEAVDELKEPYRSTVYMRYFENMGPKAIAKAQDVPENTVKTRLTRAHEQLRARLRPDFQDQRGNWAPALIGFAGNPFPNTTSLLPLVAAPLLMKKSILIALALCLMILVPIAMRGLEKSNEGLEREGTSPLASAATAGESELRLDPTLETRETLLSEAEPTVPSTDKVVPAFPDSPAEAVGTLELTVRWPDGSPAHNVRGKVIPWNAADAFLMQRDVETNGNGVALVNQLAPGKVSFYLERGGTGKATIEAGVQTRKEITIPSGITVAGKVLSPNGKPVANATVCLSDPGSAHEGNAVALTDATGQFQLEHITGQRYLSARSPGYAPSDQLYVRGTEGSTMTLDLILRGPGGLLEGQVLSPNGHPVSGARILVEGETPPDWNTPQDGRRRTDKPLSFTIRSDATGHFRIDQVGLGTVQVQARTKSWLPWGQLVTIEEGLPKTITIQFEEGATLQGTISRVDGSPASGAFVSTGDYRGFESYRTKCGKDGRYKIDGLPGGSLEFHAKIMAIGEVTAWMNLDGTSPNVWDATLVEGGAAEGTVVDAKGYPLSKWLVGTDLESGSSTTARTGRDGTFRLSGIKPESNTLSVAPPDWIRTGSSVTLEGVLPTTQPLHIVIPDEVRPRSTAKVRVLLNGEPAPTDTSVSLRSIAPFSYRELHPGQDGMITMDRLRVGNYQITATRPNYPSLRRDFSIGVAEDKDLGTIQLEPGGRLRVEATGPGADGAIHAAVLDDNNNTVGWMNLKDGVGETQALPPGPARLRIAGNMVATQFITATVTAETTTPVQVLVTPGTTRTIRVTRKNGAQVRQGTTAVITDSAGRLVHRIENIADRKQTADGLIVRFNGLETGSYRVQVTSPTGTSVEGSFQVTTLDLKNAPEIDLAL